MSEINAAGYTALRTGPVPLEWWIELRDDSNDPVEIDDLDEGTVTRLDSSDPRVTVADDTGSQTVTFTLALEGSHVDLPTTIEASVLYASDSGGPPLTAVEEFAPFTFASGSDQCTVTHNVEVPEQT